MCQRPKTYCYEYKKLKSMQKYQNYPIRFNIHVCKYDCFSVFIKKKAFSRLRKYGQQTFMPHLWPLSFLVCTSVCQFHFKLKFLVKVFGQCSF